MFNKYNLSLCDRYMYLEFNKGDIKELQEIPRIVDFRETKNKLLNIINGNYDIVISYDIFLSKIDAIKDDNYFYFSFNKTNINALKLKKISYDKKLLELNNYKINNFYYVHINPNFKMTSPEINFLDFFSFQKIEEIADFDFNELKHIITNENKACFNDKCKKCPYIKYCISDYCNFDDSIFSLRGKIDKFISENKLLINDVDYLSLDYFQRIQVDKKEVINIDDIKKLLSSIKIPINFIDFEKSNYIIPKNINSAPFEPFYFQYSLHTYDNSINHYDDIIQSPDDLEKMAKLLNERLVSGSVVCYNIMLEKEALSFLSKKFPNFKGLNIDSSRFVDLSVIFQKGQYYNPLMKGSTTIKSVLKALTGISYNDLNGSVMNGMEAANSFSRLINSNEKDKEKLQVEMKNYCGLDTLAMIKIYEKLKEIVK